MTINYNNLLALKLEPFVQTVAAKDAILYALGVGVGGEISEQERELPFYYEEKLKFLPTFSTVIAYPGVWIARPETGIAWKHCLNGEYVVTFHRPPLRLNVHHPKIRCAATTPSTSASTSDSSLYT